MIELSQLRERIKDYIGGKRLSHTYAVEEEAAALAELFGITGADRLRLQYAALLHDITKEKKGSEQAELYAKLGIEGAEIDILSPKIMHAKTAAALVKLDFPELADDILCSQIRWHTTGRAGMTLGEKLLYLADYIEQTRTFDDCVKLRRHFYTKINKAKNMQDRLSVLHEILIESFDMTICALLEDGEPVCTDTIEARNALIYSKMQH